MAEFEMKCPHCGSALIAQEEWRGLDVECPSCSKTFAVEEKKAVVPAVVPAPIPVLNSPQVPPVPGAVPPPPAAAMPGAVPPPPGVTPLPPPSGAVPPPVAPVTPVAPMNGNMEVSKRSRTAYILWGIFFGGVGAHDFYAGYKTRGLIKLFSVLFTCLCCPFLGTATWFWAVVDICTIKVDVDEKPFA